MENKTPTEASATKKTIHNPDVEKLMEELNGKAGTDVSLHEYEILLAKAKMLSEKLGDSTILEKAVISVGEKLIRIGADRDEGRNRNVRVRSLENALKLLFDFYGKQKNEQSISTAVLVLIARACYERSVLILSRQDKIMLEKKKRIIKKGIEFAKEVVFIESNNKEALRLHCILLLELEKIDKDDRDVSKLKEALSSAIQNGCKEFNEKAEDIEISLRFAEFVKKDGNDEPLSEKDIKSLTTIVGTNLHTENIELKKAKAYYLMGNKENDVKIVECMKTFAKKLESLSFSDPGWSKAARFVIELEKTGKDCWKKIALLVWEACKKRYEESTSVEHYWYFGHLMTHYYIADLAFAAQDDIEKKVEIADFLKSKILLHGQSLDDEAERFFEYNKDVRQQHFIKGLEMVYKTEKNRTSGANRRGFKEIPKDWVVIHFYLNKYETKGYAILAYKDRVWEIKEFPYVNLFEVFITWQTNYFVNKPKYSESTAIYLIELCKEIGRVMPFLFDVANKQVLFIAHDFLHRLPLHAAMKKNAANSIEEVFLKEHQCYYLPSWSFASKKDAPVDPKGRILFNGFSENEQAYIALSELKWEKCDDFEKILSPPELLIIGCHGKADVTSSFNSKLKRKEGDITLLKLLTSKMDINGSCVIMSVCEADLVPPLSGPLDEHLSFASAQLIKNAREILGGMWIICTEDIMEIINRINNCSHDNLDVGAELWHWQREKVEEGIRDYRNGVSTSIFRSVTFRIFGLPYKYDTSIAGVGISEKSIF
ncbi:MAG: hypothetical protein NUV74_14085 [Candidatus Brocadiaceae bacterium]|nr:hypothetical protein [Candidatus Brocadiaceae bacterium]